MTVQELANTCNRMVEIGRGNLEVEITTTRIGEIPWEEENFIKDLEVYPNQLSLMLRKGPF